MPSFVAFCVHFYQKSLYFAKKNPQVAKINLDPSKKKTQLRKTPAEKPAEKPAAPSNLSSHVTKGANHVINSPSIPTNKEVILSSEVMSLVVTMMRMV